ncbi:MAG: hypothetical protein AB7Q17_08695 [Phycisphaerae bacterium]
MSQSHDADKSGGTDFLPQPRGAPQAHGRARGLAPPLARRVGAAGVAILLALAMAGCAPGIAWRLETFDRVHADAKPAGKLTFVYFRNWYDVACTNFEEQVLKSPAVLKETADLVCVPLSYDWDRALAQPWGLDRAPAFAVVAPDGAVLASGQGTITEPALLDALRSAKAQYAEGKGKLQP